METLIVRLFHVFLRANGKKHFLDFLMFCVLRHLTLIRTEYVQAVLISSHPQAYVQAQNPFLYIVSFESISSQKYQLIFFCKNINWYFFYCSIVSDEMRRKKNNCFLLLSMNHRWSTHSQTVVGPTPSKTWNCRVLIKLRANAACKQRTFVIRGWRCKSNQR